VGAERGEEETVGSERGRIVEIEEDLKYWCG
jgi:hypothetical protein